jgi:hypothetical protein
MLDFAREQIKGITGSFTYEDGSISECTLDEYNEIPTKYGNFVPQYEKADIRKKDGRALSFHRSGAVKSISLEDQTPIQTTMGEVCAELITFYEDGSLNSVFPLNGQIGFSWSEEEEGKLAKPYHFSFSFAEFSAKIIVLRFYPNGNLRSLVLWPGETIDVATQYGTIPVRIGFKLYESGVIQSIEPATEVSITTPIGVIRAYDTLAHGIDAGMNSLSFYEDGSIHTVATCGKIFIRNKKTGLFKNFFSKSKLGLTDEDYYLIPIQITFEKDTVIMTDGEKKETYQMSENEFTFYYEEAFQNKECFGNCSECSSGCGIS